MEYPENIKMLDGTTTSIFQQTKKFDKDAKETKIDELCKQVENLHLMMMNSQGKLRSRRSQFATRVVRKAITSRSVGWSRKLSVTNWVRIVIELQSVARRSIYHLCARTPIGLHILLKTVSSRGATKRKKSKTRGSPRTVSPRKPKELSHQGRIISCS